MSFAAAMWALHEAGPTTRFYVRRRTIVATAQVTLRRVAREGGSAHNTDGSDDAAMTTTSSSSLSSSSPLTCVWWCSIVPAKARQAGDGEYRSCPPFALASFTLPALQRDAAATTTTTATTHADASNDDALVDGGSSATTSVARTSDADGDVHVITAPAHRWTIEAGSTVVMTLAATTVTDDNSSSHSNDNSSTGGVVDACSCLCDIAFCLSGMHVGVPFVPAMCEWRPLLSHRWFELKPHVREATHVPTSDDDDDNDEDSDGSEEADGRRGVTVRLSPRHTRRRRRCRPRRRGRAWRPMYQGDVREAQAVSANGSFVKWADGAVGPMDEVQPYSRLYTPARATRLVRVRRYAHRHADVVGHVPHGTLLEAFGRTMDVYTRECYVCVYLPRDTPAATYSHLVALYDLTYTSAGRHVWGWTKLAGTSTLPLLAEVALTRRDGEAHTVTDLGAAAAPPLPLRVADDNEHAVATASTVAAATHLAPLAAATTSSRGVASSSSLQRDTHHNAADDANDGAMTHHEHRLQRQRQQASARAAAAAAAATEGDGDDAGGSSRGGNGARRRGRAAATTEPPGTQHTALPPQSYYVPVRGHKRVRVRASPSPRARAVGQLEVNEVREAVAMVRVPMSPNGTTSATHGVDDADGRSDMHNTAADVLYSEYVQWRDGTYSLLHDHAYTYLVPVHLTAGIRRFPVRSRTATPAASQHTISHSDHHDSNNKGSDGHEGDDDVDDDDVVDLDEMRRLTRLRQQRQRAEGNTSMTHESNSSSDDDDMDEVDTMHSRKRGRDTTPAARMSSRVAPLLSPQRVPAAVREGVQRGRVHLDDLQQLPQSTNNLSTSSHGSGEDGDTSSDAGDDSDE